MESLGQALTGILPPTELLAGPPLSPEEERLRFLTRTPTVPDVSLALGRSRQDLQITDNLLTQAIQADNLAAYAAAAERHAKVAATVEVLERRLRDAETKQAIERELRRPEGCWCLGLGGRGTLLNAEDGGRFWSEPCPCPDGQRMRRLWFDAERRELDAARVGEAQAYEREVEARIKRAGIPSRHVGYTIDTYPIELSEDDAFLVTRYGNEAYFPAAGGRRTGPSLYLHGLPSRGKTGLAVSALKLWLQHVAGGRFVLLGDLLQQLRGTFDVHDAAHAERRQQLMDGMLLSPLLVIDDFGTERVTDWTRGLMFDVIAHRHQERMPTIITSNLPLHQATERYRQDEYDPMPKRLAERILEMSDVLELVGPNLRDPNDEG